MNEQLSLILLAGLTAGIWSGCGSDDAPDATNSSSSGDPTSASGGGSTGEMSSTLGSTTNPTTTAPSSTSTSSNSGPLTSTSLTTDTSGGPTSSESGSTSNEGTTGEDGSCFSLADEVVGFGENASGGLGGAVYIVENLNDGGPGSLRAGAESAETLWIVFGVSGTIALSSPIAVQANKTIDGRGQQVTLTGQGLLISEVNNVIVENLIFASGVGDAITVYGGASDIWIDHCEISDYDDGAIDITERSTAVTVSWTFVHDHLLVMLVSASDIASYDEVITVTSHHNYFRDTEGRHPRLRFGKVHAFNNVLENWSDYGMRVHLSGQLNSEQNVFEAGPDKDAIILGDASPPLIRSQGERLLNGALASESLPGQVFDPADFYDYTAEVADQRLTSRVKDGAGWRDTSCVLR